MDSMARRMGLSIVYRSVLRRMTDTTYLQALLQDLLDPSTTIYKGGGNNKKDIVAANLQRIRHLGRGISSLVMDENAQLSTTDSRGP